MAATRSLPFASRNVGTRWVVSPKHVFDELKEIQQTSLLKGELDGGLSISLTQMIGLHVRMRDVVI